MKQTWYEKLADRHRKEGKSYMIHDREGREPYLERFYLIPRKYTFGLFQVCLHRFWASDSPLDGLHNHPWSFFSYILKGGYWEHLEGGKVRAMVQGNFRFGKAHTFHRVTLIDAEQYPTWTIFIMGRKQAGDKWGFQIGEIFYPWRQWIKIRQRKVTETNTEKVNADQ